MIFLAVCGEGVYRRRKHQGHINKTLQLLSILCHTLDCICNIRIRVGGYLIFALSVVKSYYYYCYLQIYIYIYFFVYLIFPIVICEAVLALLLPPLRNSLATVHIIKAN